MQPNASSEKRPRSDSGHGRCRPPGQPDAREIKGLIGVSVEKVEGGSRLVADAGRTMNEIVSSVRRVSGMIGEITASALAQSDGIGQVSGLVNELDRMTHQNAALVEQSATSADSLKEQAARLAQAVGTFRLNPA